MNKTSTTTRAQRPALHLISKSGYGPLAQTNIKSPTTEESASLLSRSMIAKDRSITYRLPMHHTIIVSSIKD